MRLINLSKFLLSSSLITALCACAAGGAGGDGKAYADDLVVTSKVKAALAADAVLASTPIHIDTYKGVVQLSGFVGSAEDIPRALALARKVEGVRALKNDIAVQR